MAKRRTRSDDADAASRGMALAIGEMLGGLSRDEVARRIEAGEPLLQSRHGQRSSDQRRPRRLPRSGG